jgi:hypothetical protein
MNRFEFTLLDAEGGLIALIYKYPDHRVADTIYQSLARSMKVKVLIEGPIENTKSFYNGVGIIHVLNEKA